VNDAVLASWLDEGPARAAPARPPTRVLLVEDNPGDARLVRENLANSRGAECAITHVTTLRDALATLALGVTDVVLSDLGLPDSRGIETAARLVRASPDVPVVVLTGINDDALGNEAIQRGAQDYLVKGYVDGPALWRAVRHARERAQSARSARESLDQALASQATLMRVLERNADGIVVTNPDGRVLYANTAAVALFRRSSRPLVGSTFPHRLNPNAITEVEVRDESGRPVAVVEMRVVEVEWEGAPALLASLRDLTERHAAQQAEKRMEDELKRAQRMEAVGRLAGGIAHDFNNLLTVIQGAAQLADLRLEGPEDGRDDAVRRHLRSVEAGATRAAALTRQLLAVSRRQVQTPRVVDVHALLADAEPLVRSTLGETIRLEIRSEATTSHVRADPESLREMLVNLALWAKDAMPSGGAWTISTRDVDLDMDWCNQRVGVTPGRYLLVTFADTGASLDEQAARHAFEPFSGGRIAGAAGLGLASAYGTVKQAGGTVEVDATREGGNAFHVYLPRVPADQSEEAPAAAPAPTRVSAKRPRVLLIEDMEELREIARETLAAAGYEVLVARNGVEALEKWRGKKGGVDLIVTDVMMPDMNGPDLVARVRETDPDARVLFISGYAADDLVHLGLIASGAPCLPKPFTTHQLVERVTAILGRPESPAAAGASAQARGL
jgi:two-component system cell cycle sensor histidine kinase/response regulator CckA